jgi:hypothetical protein
MRGGSAGTSTRGPENQEGACESLKGPIDISYRHFILIFTYFSGVYFQLFLVSFKKQLCKIHLDFWPQSSLVMPSKISLGNPADHILHKSPITHLII